MKNQLSRRDFLKLGAFGVIGAGGASAIMQSNGKSHIRQSPPPMQGMDHGGGVLPGTGDVDHIRNGFDPGDILTDFDYGKVSTLPDGRTLREYEITVINKNIEVVPGIEYPAWTYNGRIPGPTIRCTEGDLIRITMINGSNHPHSMHFHGFHPSVMDGVPGSGPGGYVEPGDSFTYEFDAEPFGLHLYHCHVFPLARHIAKGLYGTFIVDPRVVRRSTVRW
jgi:FtsP/CotA-like multicopper oxidase with cupredoxin domain